jgi:hypothetical protein
LIPSPLFHHSIKFPPEIRNQRLLASKNVLFFHLPIHPKPLEIFELTKIPSSAVRMETVLRLKAKEGMWISETKVDA